MCIVCLDSLGCFKFELGLDEFYFGCVCEGLVVELVYEGCCYVLYVVCIDF